jgi:hypothetical protein
MTAQDIFFIVALVLSYSLACTGLQASPLQPQPRVIVQVGFGFLVLFVGMRHFGLL